MEVEVRLFAIFRERAGRERLALELPEGATVADVLAAAAREPGLGEVLAAMPVRAALNREYVDDDAPVSAGDELALVPPVSGGSQSAAEAPRLHARVTDEPLAVGLVLEPLDFASRTAEDDRRAGAGAPDPGADLGHRQRLVGHPGV